MNNLFERFDSSSLYEEEELPQRSFFKPGTKVNCVVFDIRHPSAYVKTKDAEAEETGLTADYSYKEGGIELAIAVTRHHKEGSVYERTFTEDKEGNLTGFSIMPYVNMSSSTPSHIFNKSYNSFVKGIGSQIVNGTPKTINVFPWFPNGKNPEKDAARREEWRKILLKYEAMTEEEAKNALLETLAKRQGFGYTEKGLFHIVKPMVGLTFAAVISYGRKKTEEGEWVEAPPSPYFNITRWETKMIGNQFIETFPVDLNVSVTEESIELANKIRFLKNESLAKRVEENKEKPF
jgi:hypothetical protein